MMLKSENPVKSQNTFLNRSFFAPKKSLNPVFFQSKLNVGPVDDVYEREADTMAERVMRKENRSNGSFQSNRKVLQGHATDAKKSNIPRGKNIND